MNVRQRLPVFAAALWWGSMSVIGFMVVPLLFANLPTTAMAGQMGAKLFSAQTWVSLACGMVLLMLARTSEGQPSMDWHGGAPMFIVGGILLALLLEFAVAPRIMSRQNLALWHSLGSGMYVVQWVCAGAVLWKVSRPAS